MKREDLERMYLVEKKTLDEIGRLVGKSRQAIHYYVKKYGISAELAEHALVKCDVCGKEHQITRKRFVRSVKHFCSKECYKSYLRNSEYRQSRNGQRIARLVFGEHLGRELQKGEVVHHIDGDDNNNSISNLMLFGSHSEHLAYHHKLRRERL